MNILLASHGTPGARAAENLLYEICQDFISKYDISLTHLHVIPELWGKMLADDWLNNTCTHLRFENYLQAELKKEADENTKRVKVKLERLGFKNQYIIRYGDPNKCLIDTCLENKFDLVILGSKRPKTLSGLHSIMYSKNLSRNLSTKLLQVPYPIH